MAKTLEQIIAETGKVPPEQTMRDEDELINEIGMIGVYQCEK